MATKSQLEMFMKTMGMDSIVTKVWSYLSFDDLKRSRLVCKDYEEFLDRPGQKKLLTKLLKWTLLRMKEVPRNSLDRLIELANLLEKSDGTTVGEILIFHATIEGLPKKTWTTNRWHKETESLEDVLIQAKNFDFLRIMKKHSMIIESNIDDSKHIDLIYFATKKKQDPDFDLAMDLTTTVKDYDIILEDECYCPSQMVIAAIESGSAHKVERVTSIVDGGQWNCYLGKDRDCDHDQIYCLKRAFSSRNLPIIKIMVELCGPNNLMLDLAEKTRDLEIFEMVLRTTKNKVSKKSLLHPSNHGFTSGALKLLQELEDSEAPKKKKKKMDTGRGSY